jgi:hypothetical protein
VAGTRSSGNLVDCTGTWATMSWNAVTGQRGDCGMTGNGTNTGCCAVWIVFDHRIRMKVPVDNVTISLRLVWRCGSNRLATRGAKFDCRRNPKNDNSSAHLRTTPRGGGWLGPTAVVTPLILAAEGVVESTWTGQWHVT